MNSKGQSANELLVIYMFIMLVFTVFVASFGQQRAIEVQNAKIAMADSVGEQMANEVNFAARAGNGYSRKVIYPVMLQGVTPYNMTLNNISKSIDVQFSLGTVNYSHSFPIITSDVIVSPSIAAILPNGSPYGYVLQSSNFSFSTGQLYIQNLNGVIVISLSTPYDQNPTTVALDTDGSYVSMGYYFVNVTAKVTDTFGDPVVDGTLVHFMTPEGVVDDVAPTVNGTATALLITPTTTIVIASISGVNSTISIPFYPS